MTDNESHKLKNPYLESDLPKPYIQAEITQVFCLDVLLNYFFGTFFFFF